MTIPTSKIRVAFAFVLLASSAQTGVAQDSSAVMWTRHTIQSKKLNEERPIYVALPGGYATSTRAYPVLVILDANDAPQFNAAIANTRFLANRGAITPLIIVGIPNGRDRTHDLTPAPSPSIAKNFPTAGGADAFADFIADEVLPLVRSTYRTRPATVFAGHSFGGLIALHIAATRPTAYTGIIAMSPAMWWNDSTVVTQYSDAIAKAAAPQRIFATSGGLEAPIDITTKRFAARLDSIKPKSVAFAYRHYPDDTHGLTPDPSLVDGLRFVFEPISTAKLPIARLGPARDSAWVAKALAESEATYARGARLFGEPEKLPEFLVNQVGYFALNQLRKPGYAVSIFRRNVADYPESANTYDSLGDGLLAKGDTTAAIAEFRRAVAVGTRTNDGVVPVSRGKLETLEKAVTQAGKPQRP